MWKVTTPTQQNARVIRLNNNGPKCRAVAGKGFFCLVTLPQQEQTRHNR
jgi:hypothetical protein